MTNENNTVDVAALELLCDKLECGDANHRATAEQIRDAVKGAKPQLPEGIEWPRFEDGELVKFGDEIVVNGKPRTVEEFVFTLNRVRLYYTAVNCVCFDYGEPVKRPEPEVLDADGVPIKVGDTVWNINNGKKYEVLKLPRKGSYQSVMVRGEDGTDGFDPDRLTHRKPDTQEAIDADCLLDASDYCEKHGIKVEHKYERGKAKCKHLLERQRKLMGGVNNE